MHNIGSYCFYSKKHEGNRLIREYVLDENNYVMKERDNTEALK